MGVTQEIIKSLSLQNAKVRERLMDFKIKNEISNGFISGQDFLFQCKLCFSRLFIENLRAQLLTALISDLYQKKNKLNCTSRLYFIIAWNIRLFMIQVGDKDGKDIKAMYTISV